MASNRVYAIAIDSNGKKWFGGLGVSELIEYTENAKPGDVNRSGEIDLTDLVIVLKVLSGIKTDQPVYLSADVNNDNKIGLAEAAYVLQYISDMRNP